VPPRDSRIRIEDMLDAIAKIMRYTNGMTLSEFEVDEKTIDAVTRNLGVIGEAARHISDEMKQREPQIPWVEISGMRNFVIHQYADVSLLTIWNTVQRNLPPLVPLLQSLLETIV
jgi:uncharacterized protein with HEPN domain